MLKYFLKKNFENNYPKCILKNSKKKEVMKTINNALEIFKEYPNEECRIKNLVLSVQVYFWKNIIENFIL